MDINTVSYIAIDRSPASRRNMNRVMRDHQIAISTITEGEVLFGLAKNPGAKAASLRASVQFLRPTLSILAWDSSAAHAYGALLARPSALGKPILALDMLIAAHAISSGAILVTHDKAFAQVAGLSTVDWATDL